MYLYTYITKLFRKQTLATSANENHFLIAQLNNLLYYSFKTLFNNVIAL